MARASFRKGNRRFTSRDAIGIGVAVRDLTVVLDRFPHPDEKIRARDFAESGGGPVPTALVTMARLGDRVSFVGVVGDDAAGKFILEGLRCEGVDTSGVITRSGFHSPTSVILVESGRRTICEFRQSDLPLGLADLSPQWEALERCRFLLLDARLPEIQIEAARIARRAGRAVVLDCGHPRPGVEEILRLSDIAILSESYPRAMAGAAFDVEVFLRELGARLAADGLRIAGLTLGARGCVLSVAGSPAIWIPGIPVEALDTTGAGDVFHGAFAHALLRGDRPEEAARFGNAAAALKCRGLTGRAPLPPEDDIRLLAKSGSKVT